MRTELHLNVGSELLIGSSYLIQEVISKVEKAARSDCCVMISGQTGTGKEEAAKLIHRRWCENRGKAPSTPFVAINCGAIPDNLVESEIFGHEAGSFTGAVRTKKGLLEFANGGIAFLDEISELSQAHQVKFLRFLQDQKIRRVGGTKEITVKVRIIAGTNANLQERVRERKFREDLFYRLDIFPIKMPALRHHPSDIPELVQHYYTRYNLVAEPKVRLPIEPAIPDLLRMHDWPGNVRELFNILERAAVNCDYDTSEEEIILQPGDFDLPDGSRVPGSAAQMLADFCCDTGRVFNAQDWRDAHHEYITRLLEQNEGNQKQTARLLGVNRTTLTEWLKRDNHRGLIKPYQQRVS